jgi:hypothetical protein
MKKVLISFFAIFILAALVIYVFIPGQLHISQVSFVKAKQSAVYRNLADKDKWYKWWPSIQPTESSVKTADTKFYYKNVAYIVNATITNAIDITIQYKDKVINSIINVVPLNNDSAAIEWKSEITTGMNPVKRVNAYYKAEKIKRDMADILENVKMFLDKPQNIYGLNIVEEKVKDTFLVAIKSTSDTYPAISTIYKLIKILEDHILANGSVKTNYPMLHVTQDSGIFKTMVAIPVNKSLPTNNKILFKRMIPGRILVTEVTGGKYSTDNALRRLRIYLDENQLGSPAIPFESLVTDRLKEPDTAKWITRIYYPIF